MNKFPAFFLVFCAGVVLANNSYSSVVSQDTQETITTSIAQTPKNLKGIPFSERADIEKITDELATSANDPYTTSLPLMASAGLGDEKRYVATRTQMLARLNALDQKPNDFPQWMRNNSFKAWMLGRALLSADDMNDTKTVEQTKNKLTSLLEGKITQSDNFAFFTWAQGYQAALNKTEYETAKKRMIQDSMQLSEKYKNQPTDHGALSDALWAWVMALSASANANDKSSYELIKQQMTSLVGVASAAKALDTGLLRTADSNDYPAWALAKMRLAAAMMHDKALYEESSSILTASITGAKQAGAKAEYALAVIDNQLAIHTQENCN
jgi:hypothetical protein